MIVRALAVWFLLFVIAFGMGVLREALLTPRIGETAAHVVGTFVVVALFLVTIGLSVGWVVPSLETGRLLWLGVGWTVLTVAFEFGFGRYVMGHPWSRLLHDYNLFAGRLWLLVLLTLLLGPWLLGRLQAS